MEHARFAVVGGSIAGCIAATLLRRTGSSADVFERSCRPLVGQGASIVLARPVFDKAVAEGLLADDLPSCAIVGLDYVIRDAGGGSRRLGCVPLTGRALHWSALFQALRATVPDGDYHLGAPVTGLSLLPEKATLCFDAGASETYDLVVCADGHRSLGRDVIDPEARLHSDGIVLLRGTAPESPADGCLSRKAVRILYTGGHGICYFIPGAAGTVTPGERRVSFSFYLQAAEARMLGLVAGAYRTDADRGSEGGDARPPALPDLLASFLADRLPDYYAELVGRGSEFYVQPITSVTVRSYVSGRSCLVGDASSMFPPYSNSGVATALQSAATLVAALNEEARIDAALARWNREQLAAEKVLRHATDNLADRLITDVPDLGTMRAGDIDAYIQAIHPGLSLNLPS